MAQQNNTEFMTELMEFSRTGPVMQLFILDTLAKYAKIVTEMPVKELQQAFGENTLISAEPWQDAAKEFQQKFKEHGHG